MTQNILFTENDGETPCHFGDTVFHEHGKTRTFLLEHPLMPPQQKSRLVSIETDFQEAAKSMRNLTMITDHISSEEYLGIIAKVSLYREMMKDISFDKSKYEQDLPEFNANMTELIGHCHYNTETIEQIQSTVQHHYMIGQRFPKGCSYQT